MRKNLKRMLPFLLAFVLMLGSSLTVQAATIDDIQNADVIQKIRFIESQYPDEFDADSNYFYFVKTNGEVAVSYSELVVELNESGIYTVYSTRDPAYFCYLTPDSKLHCGKWSAGDSSLSVFIAAKNGLATSNFKIYKKDGTLFFRPPSPLMKVVETVDLTAVLKEIISLTPLLILFLVGLEAFWKGLRFLSSILHQA